MCQKHPTFPKPISELKRRHRGRVRGNSIDEYPFFVHNRFMEIINRRQAIASGLKHFYTGKPCKHGHLTERYVGNGGCLECLRPKTTAITVTGEILPAINEREEIRKMKLSIEQQKINLKAQDLLITAQHMERKLLVESQIVELKIKRSLILSVDRQERAERRERTVLNKTHNLEAEPRPRLSRSRQKPRAPRRRQIPPLRPRPEAPLRAAGKAGSMAGIGAKPSARAPL